LQPIDRGEQLFGVGIAVSPGVFGKESPAALARRQRFTECLIIAFVRCAGQLVRSGGYFVWHVQSLRVRLSIMWLDSASEVAPGEWRPVEKTQVSITGYGELRRADAA
jgi:hypothetical protein